ncbi:hypothetical protein JOL62DRAFT_562358 [Phyllosticta paracitricarpa]|uniref:Uncharacterized protein n=1 Tax=Phyllosticta paracitricarpa TaxID=2016321 RepID=A0ABR1NL13_9PEZI
MSFSSGTKSRTAKTILSSLYLSPPTPLSSIWAGGVPTRPGEDCNGGGTSASACWIDDDTAAIARLQLHVSDILSSHPSTQKCRSSVLQPVSRDPHHGSANCTDFGAGAHYFRLAGFLDGEEGQIIPPEHSRKKRGRRMRRRRKRHREENVREEKRAG